MSVSSINSGFSPNQPALKSPASARAERQPALPSAPAQVPAAADSAEDSSKVSVGSSIPAGNRVGVAAYIAIMNPQNSTSMRAEA